MFISGITVVITGTITIIDLDIRSTFEHVTCTVFLEGHREIRGDSSTGQWPFQEPKLELRTIYKAHVRAMYGDIPPKNGLTRYSNSILGS